MDNFSLFAANAVVAFVLASVFWTAGRAANEVFLRTWSVGYGVIALALLAFMWEAELPDLFVATVPNGLLIFGMSLRWYGARQFERRPSRTAILWAPTMVFIGVCSFPFVSGSYAAVYTVVNVILALLALATATQYRGEAVRDPLPAGG